MVPSRHVRVEIDLGRVREQARMVKSRVGVDVLAVVKGDAYGLGARRVAEAIGDVVEGFCVFNLAEAIVANLWEVGKKPILALGPVLEGGLDDFARAQVRPAVSTEEGAKRWAAARPVVCVDTGMGRFACEPGNAAKVMAACGGEEAFTHAVHVEQARMLAAVFTGKRLRLHAAGSSLVDEPEARLSAVRPGMALYRGAVRVWTTLVEVHGYPARRAGYGGFTAARYGVVMAGYANGVRGGHVRIHGENRRILEVGMQSAFVELGPAERAGDRVYFLGDGLTEAEVARDWGVTEQGVLTSLCGSGERIFSHK